MKPITESLIEQSAIGRLQAQGWAYVNGKDISPEGMACERESFSQIPRWHWVCQLKNDTAFAGLYCRK
ncbi:MAG: hypothetical protein H6577_00460 [Lewinellaceae bacterium]|nr:hypothetical protein [Lewinellaceae bacterium]